MDKKRQQLLLGVLGVLVALLLVTRWWSGSSSAAGTAAAPAPAQAAPPATRPAPLAPEVTEVHLDALALDRDPPEDVQRNLFRFEQASRAAAVPATVPVPGGPRPTTLAPTGLTGAPGEGAPVVAPLAPITLKFIGIVEPPLPAGKLAVLSDGRNVFQGREGDVIEGRYRILRIGVQSVEMAYLDGRGRQTIRLSGS